LRVPNGFKTQEEQSNTKQNISSVEKCVNQMRQKETEGEMSI